MTRMARVSKVFWRISIPLIWEDLEECEGNRHLCHLLQIVEDPEPTHEVMCASPCLGVDVNPVPYHSRTK